MNHKNYEYLKEQLLYSGFGNGLEDSLKDNLQRQPEGFQLLFQTGMGKGRIRAELNFSRSSQSDMYFFNSYRLEIVPQGTEQRRAQLFYVNGRDRYTLKEAYNLMHGRSVFKELSNRQGDRYEAWVQLDLKTMDINGNHRFRQFHKNYGFDLQSELNRYPIKELEMPDRRQDLIDALQRGNRQPVTMDLEKGETRLYLQANPQFKVLNVYDENGIRQEFLGTEKGMDLTMEKTDRKKLSTGELSEAKKKIHGRKRGLGG